MTELYWITRLDAINNAALTFLIFLTTISIFAAIAYYIFNGQHIFDDAHDYKKDSDINKHYAMVSMGVLKWSLPITIFCLLVNIFTPSTKEALLIYGIGGTIDYIKSNDTAKQLPDKCINALDKWVDSFSEEDKKKEK